VDGDVLYVMLLEAHDSHVPSCGDDGRPVPGRGIMESSRQLRVVRVTAASVEDVHILWTWRDSWPDVSPRPRPVYDAVAGSVFVTFYGDLVGTWHRVSAGAGGVLQELRVTRVARSGTTETVREGPWYDRDTLHALLDGIVEPRLYLSDGSVIEAIDLASAETKWIKEAPGTPFFAYDRDPQDGLKRIARFDPDRGLLADVDDNGDVIRTRPASITEPRAIVYGNGILHGTDPSSRAFVEIAFPNDAGSVWAAWFDVDPIYDAVARRLAGLD
jgi:hypothetical protein